MIGTIEQTKFLLDKYNLSAKKKYGQNFLIEPTIINKIIQKVDEEDVVIEIGPGLGSLTEQLAIRCKRVIAYEIDVDMYNVLTNELKYENLEIINQDFLEFDFSSINQKVTIVSNLPYYITTELLTKIFANSEKVKKIIVMMQKEVGERFFKKEIDKDYSALQVISQFYSDVSVVTKVNKNNFLPAPKVDSVVLEFLIKDYDNLKINDKLLTEIIKASFSQRRKMVISNLINSGYTIAKKDLEELHINPMARVEQLCLQDYLKIYEVINERESLRKD